MPLGRPIINDIRFYFLLSSFAPVILPYITHPSCQQVRGVQGDEGVGALLLVDNSVVVDERQSSFIIMTRN